MKTVSKKLVYHELNFAGFITEEKRCIFDANFAYFFMETYVVGAH